MDPCLGPKTDIRGPQGTLLMELHKASWPVLGHGPGQLNPAEVTCTCSCQKGPVAQEIKTNSSVAYLEA